MRLTLPEENDASQSVSETHVRSSEDSLEVSHLKGLQKRRYLLQKERAKLQDMTGTQRFRYFFDYYMRPLLILLLILTCVILIVYNIRQNMRPQALRLVILNTDSDAGALQSFEEAYRNALSIPQEEKIELFASYKIRLSTYEEDIRNADPSTATDYEILTSYALSDYLDAVITDQDGLDYMVDTDLTYNLRTVFSDDTLQALEARIVYADIPADKPGSTEENQEMIRVPIALDLRSCKQTAALALPYEEAYLAFPCVGKTNLTNAARLIAFLFEEV